MKSKRKYSLLFTFLFALSSAQVDTLFVYGAGGPKPPMMECAKYFQNETKIPVKIIAGPMKQWKEKAEKNASLLFSGSDYMMNDFVRAFPQNYIDSNSILPLYFRKLGMVVRKGNPQKINSIQDLAKKNIKILVVDGAGLTGTWEDVFAKSKNIELYRTMRKNISYSAENSGQAEKKWNEDPRLDVWITWNSWQILHKKDSDFVTLPKKNEIKRSCGIVLTQWENENAKKFYHFLQSNKAHDIFKKWSWE